MVAPRIIWRYILRDVLLHALIGLLLISLLLVVQNVLRYVEQLVSVGIGLSGLAQLVAVILPSYLSYAIPTSLLFGILISFGRMSADGEIVAIRASGISVPRLLPPVLVLGGIAALVTGYMLWELEPQSTARMRSLLRELAKTVRIVEPGTFRPLGDRMLYVHEAGDDACPLRGVLISDFSDPERSLYISAQCGSIADANADHRGEDISLVLTNGSIHFSQGDDSRYRKIRFAQMTSTLDLSAYIHMARRARDRSFAELLSLRQRYAAGEDPLERGDEGRLAVATQIQRRLAFPFASMLLAILAVPLGIRPLRAGRSAGALTAIGVMALYWCLFSVGELVAENGYAPVWISVWTPNLLLLGSGLWLMRRTIYGDT